MMTDTIKNAVHTHLGFRKGTKRRLEQLATRTEISQSVWADKFISDGLKAHAARTKKATTKTVVTKTKRTKVSARTTK